MEYRAPIAFSHSSRTQSAKTYTPSRLSSLSYQLYTVWLFTESDTPTFVLPNTLFGIFGALAGQGLLSGTPESALQILQRLPLVLLFNWSNLLIFDLANQRLPESVVEDEINKPWRPIPAGRLSMEQARKFMSIATPLVLLVNLMLGTERETMVLFGLTWLYNDKGGGDGLLRNVIIAFAFAFYNLGSLRLSIGMEQSITQNGMAWIAGISGVILTTMHSQDLKDQEGDAKRGRKTLPLVMGNTFCRWTLASCIVAWSCGCACFWKMRSQYTMMIMALGIYIAIRIIGLREPKADARSWKLWCLWTAVLYMCPLLHAIS